MNLHPDSFLNQAADMQHLNLALAHYQERFMGNPHVKKRLVEQTGIDEAKAYKLGIGFGDRTLSHKLPKLETVAGDSIRGALQRVGFVKPNGREKFRGAVTIPIYQEGKLVDVYGYWFGKNLRHNRLLYEALFESSGALFNVDCLRDLRSALVCMTPFDAIALMHVGVNNVISPLSQTHFSDANLANLICYGIKHVCVCIPNTEKGRRFAISVRQSTESIGLSCDVQKATFPIRFSEAMATLVAVKPINQSKAVAPLHKESA